MSDLIERYRNLVKTGFDYAGKDKGDAPTSTFEIYMGHFSDIGREIEVALSEAEQRVQDARREALEEAAKVAERFEVSYAQERDKHDLGEPEHIRNNTGSYAAMDIVFAIRALQSEER